MAFTLALFVGVGLLAVASMLAEQNMFTELAINRMIVISFATALFITLKEAARAEKLNRV